MTTYLIWLDSKVGNEENIKYIEDLSQIDSLRIRTFKDIDNAINYLKTIEFQETKIIVSDELYSEFVNKFKENLISMFIVPKIIVLLNNKEKFFENNKDYHINKFYSFGGIINSINEIKNIINIDIDKTFIKKIYDVQITFEYINKKEKLMLPLFFKALIKDISNDDIEKFTSSLYKNYFEKNYEIKNLLNSINLVPNIPIEILSKYYSRFYTAKTDFYKDINKALELNQAENYLPFIKVLYEGIKSKSLPLYSSKSILYKGIKISNDEILNIKNYLEKKIEGLHSIILFTKSFLSFSKDKSIAEQYLTSQTSDNKSEDIAKVLLVLDGENNNDINLCNNCDLEKISFYPGEREVLFFPFTSFVIKEIKEIKIENEKGYEIQISYLDKYVKDLYKDTNIIIDENIITESIFKNHLIESGLINKEIRQDINIIKLYNYFQEKFGTNIINIHKNNFIIGEIKIKEGDINKDILIINSFENGNRGPPYNNYVEYIKGHENEYENEKEIIDNIEIIINEKKIDFSYTYKFEKEGTYIIKYCFKKNLTKTNHMFFACRNMVNLDFSNFDSQNVTNMCQMISMSSILKLNFLNFNTENVTNMYGMFRGCANLTDLDLSSFNTRNVTDMAKMFMYCRSLAYINLSSFNTQNVTDMNNMFYFCDSLKDINLSNFNTQNTTNMFLMFAECHSLISLDLSNFNTQNITNMRMMFACCFSLTNLNISNFNTQNATDMSFMFYGCKLKKHNIIVKDDRILNNFNY